MPGVNWGQHLDQYKAKVIFSALSVPDTIKPVGRNVAAITLANGEVVDIEWHRDKSSYHVRRVDRNYDSEFDKYDETDPSVIVRDVVYWSKRAWESTQPVAITRPENASVTAYAQQKALPQNFQNLLTGISKIAAC